MDRRDFFALKKKPNRKTPAASIVASRNIDSGLNAYTGQWTTAEVAHLLKRTMFGAKKADIDYFKGMSVSQAVDTLLNVYTTAPLPPLKNYDDTSFPAGNPDLTVAQGTTWVNVPTDESAVQSKRIGSWKSWWMGLMINQQRTIQEKMVLFWHNHFSTETNEYNHGVLGYRHNAMLRDKALGNFKDLVKAVTIDGAMLRYLNGYLNTNTAPDENYARELQELFTVGKENNPNYTEDDVYQAARVLTGWRIKWTDDTIYFDDTKHDTGSKTFSSFYGGTVVAGRTGATAGEAELDALLTMIFNNKTAVSEFIVGKLYRWFCYYTIDAATQTNVIKPLAQLFRDSNWEIKPVLTTLFKSEHFFDPLNQGCLIKSPVDLTVGLMREFNVEFPDSSDYVNAYNMWEYTRNQSSNVQQNIGDPPSVSGWPAYYQLPAYHEMWINTDTLPRRNMFTDQMIMAGYTRNGETLQIDPIAFAKTLSNPADPNVVINETLDILYRVPISENSKSIIKKQILLSAQEQDYYWSNAWNALLANPGDMTAYQTVYTRLQSLLKYFMNLAEYQLS
ncbi:MAG: DUF1800 domain-containing protein [Chitinophagaceae bacterium]